jgi:DNA-binding NarL/FixJ family response regulator
MDMTIPGGMGGKEAIQELRVIDPNVKAIVSSGYSYDPIMANFKDYGFKAVLSKPYKGIMELSQILDNVIKGRT